MIPALQHANAHAIYAHGLLRAKRIDEAAAACRRAITIAPGCFNAYGVLAHVFLSQGRNADAIESLKKALTINDGFIEAHQTLIFMLEMADIPTSELQAARRQFADRFCISPMYSHALPPPHKRGGKLRVGFVSADFCHHSMMSVIAPIIEYLPRDEFEVYCYSSTVDEDEMTQRLATIADRWHNVQAMPDGELVRLIRQDKVDILVDCSGYTGGSRLPVFARRPAPVQVTHCWGSGLRTMDYMMADRMFVPQFEEALYSEKIEFLRTWFCYTIPPGMPEIAAPPQGAPVTFGVLNRLEKISDTSIQLWAQILKAKPDAHLLVKAAALSDPHAYGRLMDRLTSAGIHPSRLWLRGSTPSREHLEVYNEVDVVLDPLPMTGGVSSLDALAMGRPVVTLYGQSFASRSTSSILTAMGIPELIAKTEEEYVLLALKLAMKTSEGARVNFRATLRGTVARQVADPLCYGMEVANAYLRMYYTWGVCPR